MQMFLFAMHTTRNVVWVISQARALLGLRLALALLVSSTIVYRDSTRARASCFAAPELEDILPMFTNRGASSGGLLCCLLELCNILSPFVLAPDTSVKVDSI